MATCIKTCKANGHPKSTQLKGKTVVGGGGGLGKFMTGAAEKSDRSENPSTASLRGPLAKSHESRALK